tara:strand:+ start:529 stop:795 length:267 start_codon:yes stop_codon:yes gene_type:complete
MSDKDTGFPNLITGKSFLKHNETVETNLEVIENNNLTILNHLCSPKKIPESIPPPPIKKVHPEKSMDLKRISMKNNSSIYTSTMCVHQ